MDCKLRAKNCGGCPLLGLDYAAQLKQKEEKVRALLGKYGPVHPIRGMEQPYHYRNKVISTFAPGWGGKLTSGIYAANSHKVLPVESCLLQDEVLDKTMQAVRAAANACRYQPYDEDKGTGLVRHCLLRRGVATGQVMVVLDAYCGIGTIGLTAADHAKQVVGVELNRDAVQDAIGNAKHNGVKNARFFAADATRWISEAAAAGEKADVIFMDPPREGSTPEFLASVARMAPKRVVYVSCNPVTLARDLATLTKLGYKAEGFTPVDMFPHTEHIETVVLLSKGEVDSKKIRVEFSLEDMDMSEFQDGATYTQIKDYVLEHSGLKVSNLYISQIKRKCGIEVGKNYNLPKSEDSRQPQCPPEKEKAIREAFKYFGMI